MARGHYSQSLDIGKDLEQEKAEEGKEQEPLPCFCRPKFKARRNEETASAQQKAGKEENSGQQAEEKPAQEKQEEKHQGNPAEKTAESSASETSGKKAEQSGMEKAEEELLKEEIPRTEQQGQEAAYETPKEPDPAEEDINAITAKEIPRPEQPEETRDEPQKEPDPAEEDINAIITKEIPALHIKKSLLERVFERKILLLVIFIALVGFVFLSWTKILPERQKTAGPEALLIPPGAVPAQANITPEPGIVPEIAEQNPVPEEPGQKGGNASPINELPDFLANQLKD